MTVQGRFKALNLSCAGCAMNVEKALKAQSGVVKARVNYADSSATVEYLPETVTPEQLRHAVRDAGYDLDIDTIDETLPTDEDNASASLKYKTFIAAAFAVVVATISMSPHLMHLAWVAWVSLALSSIVVFGCGSSFFVNAWRQARRCKLNMDTLVALSTGVAYAFSVFSMLCPQFWTTRGLPVNLWFETATVIIAFILVGKLLENRAKRKTTSAIRRLIGLQPKEATIIRTENGQPETISIKALKRGDCVLVRPGEKTPVDGVISQGFAALDESMITGEALPKDKGAGDKVYAGTINIGDAFRLVAETTGDETVLSQLIRLVREAQSSRPPLQRLADRVVALFVPVVVAIACIAAVLWLAFDSMNPTVHALLAFVTTLIVACPCALGLATPTAVMVGVGRGAAQGILFKDTDTIENLSKINTLILDKTGTVTEGKPAVSAVMLPLPVFDGRAGTLHFDGRVETFHFDGRVGNPDSSGQAPHSDGAYSVLYTMEQHSAHPLSKAITTALVGVVQQLDNVEVESVQGAGLAAVYKGKKFFAGNERLLPVSDEVVARWKSAREAEGQTVVCFGDEEHIINAFAISDKVKANAFLAVKQLKDSGIEVSMATGDNRLTAAFIAKEVGIEHFEAEMMPEDKLQLVRAKRSEGKTVAMVGDGVNDSAALAAADVSIAMGNGSDIAIEAAGLTLVSGEMDKIADAIALSRATVRTIRQNLFWAFFYNVLALPIAAGALYPACGFLLDPMLAGAAMALSSVCVVSNSLRLR